jgi:hypothetical protein
MFTGWIDQHVGPLELHSFSSRFAGPTSLGPKTLGRVIANYYLLKVIINKKLTMLLILQD